MKKTEPSPLVEQLSQPDPSRFRKFDATRNHVRHHPRSRGRGFPKQETRSVATFGSGAKAGTQKTSVFPRIAAESCQTADVSRA